MNMPFRFNRGEVVTFALELTLQFLQREKSEQKGSTEIHFLESHFLPSIFAFETYPC